MSLVIGPPPKVIWIRRGNCSVQVIEDTFARLQLGSTRSMPTNRSLPDLVVTRYLRQMVSGPDLTGSRATSGDNRREQRATDAVTERSETLYDSGLWPPIIY